MAETIIAVDAVSKRYRLGRLWRGPYQPVVRLARRMRNACRRAWTSDTADADVPPETHRSPAASDTLWALRDVSFTVARGEVLGLIGRNGAGKSTLLKILSRIAPPSSGRITMRGRVASLLEVGTGFHPELTGRDNVYLNGAILGMTRSEIRGRFDQIVEFAGVERFLDTPVKRYSSGMYVRLAFAVAAHLEPEILIVDEVLAVGDVAFQQKCLGKMHDIAESGRTVLFVSHNMSAISHFCSRAILLDSGRLIDEGEPTTVVARYVAENFVAQRQREFQRNPSARMQIRGIALRGEPEGPGGLLLRTEPFEVTVYYDVGEPTLMPEVTVMLERADGVAVCHTRDLDCERVTEPRREPGSYETRVRFPGGLLNAGCYTIRVRIQWNNGREVLDYQEGMAFELHDPTGEIASQSSGRPRPGVLYLSLPWNTRRASDGAAPGPADVPVEAGDKRRGDQRCPVG